MRKEFRVYEGFDRFIYNLIGLIKRFSYSSRQLRKKAKESYEYSKQFNNMEMEEFKRILLQTSHDIRRKRDDQIKYVAVIAQAVKRVLGISAYIEQLMGVHALIDSKIIQMYTGEGKTLTAAMGAIYKAWQTNNCHVVTSNDYLAKRDALKMQELFEYCNLSVGFITSEIEPTSRKEVYNQHIVYSTSKELLADYLRDKNKTIFQRYPTQELFENIFDDTSKVMRGLSSVIIDEADSVLADEATVPLIIATQEEQKFFHEALQVISNISNTLKKDNDYKIDTKHKEVGLTNIGKNNLANFENKIPRPWNSEDKREYLLKQILSAKYFYKRNIDYVIEKDEIVIIDEKTGRLMEGRSWGGALHQAIEINEGVPLTHMTKIEKKMSFQFFFRLYKDLSGMSGTLHNINNEIWEIYETITVKIPSHKEKQIKVFNESIHKKEFNKWNYVASNAIQEANKGRSVLVGTRSIDESILVYNLIKEEFNNVTLLNATFQKEEADIIAQAGKAYKITIATNMAGRGTDIELDDEVLENGGLHVISTQRHESKRVDMQLYGRAGRQGQKGSIKTVISLEDYIFENYMPKYIRDILSSIIKHSLGRKLAILLSKILQFLAEKKTSNLRKGIFINDIKTLKKLSFTS